MGVCTCGGLYPGVQSDLELHARLQSVGVTLHSGSTTVLKGETRAVIWSSRTMQKWFSVM